MQIAGSTTVSVVPAGWTLDFSQGFGGGSRTFLVYKKIASGEPASWAWTLSGATSYVAHCGAFQDIDPTGIAGSGQLNGSSTSITAPSQNPAVGGGIMCGFFGVFSTTTISPAGGMTEVQDDVQSTFTLELAWEAIAASGATGTRVATAGSAGQNIGYLVVILPSTVATNASMLYQFASMG